MAKFRSSETFLPSVASVCRGTNVRCAVAFWGRGSAALIRQTSGGRPKIICNLSMGGTNPAEIRTLRLSADIRQSDTLHAKVYLSDVGAVVGSANASANGLGLEGSEQVGWQEAGVALQNIAPVVAWFEEQWALSRAVDEADLSEAEEAWKKRRSAKPRLPSFADFDPNADPMPLISWWAPANVQVRQDAPEVAELTDAMVTRLSSAVTVRGTCDRRLVRQGTNMLFLGEGRLGPKRGIKTRSRMYWLKIEAVIFDALLLDGHIYDAALWTTDQVPFTVDDRFQSLARELAVQPPYWDSFFAGDDDEDWYSRHADDMRRFWVEMLRRYLDD